MATSTIPTSCVYCGDAPTNHILHYIDAGVSSALTILSRPRERRYSTFLDVEQSPVVRAIARILLQALALLHIVTFSEDISKARMSRTKSIWKEAQRRGIRMQDVVVFGLHRDVMRAWLPKSRGSAKYTWHYFDSVPIPPWLPQRGSGWIDDKYALKKVFTTFNLPIPRGGTAISLKKALNIMDALGIPVITKPQEGSRGRHTTINITTHEELVEAFARAKQLCPLVLVEEFIPGRVYRATCVGKKVVGIMELVRPTIVADGVMTVDELRIHYNIVAKRYPHLTDVQDNDLYRFTIAHQGYTVASVPPKGAEILLAEFSERSNGGFFVDCTDQVPNEIIATIEHGAEVCDVDLVGFDIISKDLTDKKEKFFFIEANGLPFIEIHEIPYEGTPRNASAAVWDLWMNK